MKEAEDYYNIAVDLQKEGKLSDAKMFYEKALRLDPMMYQAYNNLGNILCKLGDWEKGLGYYKRALDIKRDFPLPYYNMGVLMHEKGMIVEGLKYLREAEKLGMKDKELFLEIAEILYEVEEYEDALTHFLKVIEGSEEGYAYMGAGFCYFKLGKLKEAREMLEKAKALGIKATEGELMLKKIASVVNDR